MSDQALKTHKNWTLAAVCLGIFMLLVDVTIIVVALPSIRADLHTSFSDIQWTIDAYSLSLAAFLLPSGSLADILGHRRVFAFGLAIFTLGSLLCGLAQSGLMLILCRAFQGLGGATVFSTSLALLAQTFHGRERGVAFGVWGAVAGAATGLGPLLGGLITTYISWRWIFFVNLPVGIVAIAITLTKIGESRTPSGRRIDIPGFIVFTLGLFGLVYGLIESSRRGWSDPVVIGSLIAAAVLLAAFPVIERRRREPMFDLELFRKPAFVGGLVAAFGMNASLYGILLYLTLFLQEALRYSAFQTGLRLAVVTVVSMIVAVPAGRASQLVSVRWLIGPGLLLVGLGLLMMRGLGADSGWTTLLAGFVVAGAGSGLVNPPLASTAIGVVKPQDAGMASGINTTFRQIGLATSIAALGSIFAHNVAGTTRATLHADFASTLNELLLISALVALVTGVVSMLLLRPKDFVAHGPQPDATVTPERATVTADA